MEAIILVGLPAAGKSTFYQQRFFHTHIRINLDMLKTRHRERRLLHACIEMKQPFVVDNTNPEVATRAVYIEAAREAGFRVAGYYLQADVVECRQRNEQRTGSAQVPPPAISNVHSRMQVPTYAEGFAMLYLVQIGSQREFVVTECPDTSKLT
jgi:predicted kinase